MSTTTIRAATTTDFDAWLPLWRGYQTFYKVDLPEATTRTTWQRLLDPAETMHLALAERGSSLVGMVHFIEHRSTWSERNSIYLQDLFTVPAARGHGVGRALIEHVYARARALGCAEVHWLTHESNAEAMVLYNKIADRPGFVHYGKDIE